MGFVPWIAFAQTSAYQPAEVGEGLRQRVLIVSFHSERSYFSDCDKALAGQSKIRHLEVRNQFQEALEESLRSSLGKNYIPVELTQDMTGEDAAYYGRYHRTIGLAYEAPTRLANQEGEVKWVKKFRDRLSNIRLGKKKGEQSTKKKDKEVEAYSWVSTPEDQYLAVKWPINGFLGDLVETYSADYILTINQFEVKTDYRKCVDRELGNFTRKIRVHFNIFSSTGTCIYGDVVTVNYNSTTEEVENIIDDNFPLLSEYIVTPLSMPISSN